MDTPTNSSGKKIGIIAAVVIILAIIAFVLWRMNEATAPITAPENSNATSTPTTAVSNNKYRDGSYTASGNYTSPAGQETVDISLTIKDDVVTAATFKGHGVNPTTKLMQGKFAAGFAEVVVGKPIDQIQLTVVNGSSLTPKGFMDALLKVKTEAAVTA